MSRPHGMILAAGFGTRLESLTSLRPKPMLPVCGKPLVEWCARWLAQHGVADVAINLHHLGDQIEAHLGTGESLEMRIQYSHEEGEILGTGGGLLRARPLLDAGNGAPIVVTNGKIITDIDLGAALEFHERGGHEATMVLREDLEGVWKGNLRVTGDGRLGSLVGESLEGVTLDSRPMMFTGVHILEPSMLDRIPREGSPCVVRTAYRDAFREGRVGAFVTGDYWWEHSTIARYLTGVSNVLDHAVTRPWWSVASRAEHEARARAGGATVKGPIWMEEDVTLGAGVVLGAGSQLEAGAEVLENVSMERGVVWAGARVSTSFREGVWTRDGLTR